MKLFTPTTATIKTASFWQRLVAFMLDNTIISIFSMVTGAIFSLPDSIEYWLYFILFYTYNIVCEHYQQATLGKMILRLKVIAMDGAPPSIYQSFSRNISKILSTLILFYGYLRILAPHQKQTLHDEIGKCFVIESSKVGTNL